MSEDKLILPPFQPTLRVIPMPSDVNVFGSVFGGWVMSQVDLAGGVEAMRRAAGRCATVSVNSFLFKQPIDVGDLVSFYTTIIKEGQTSLTIVVEVFAQRFALNGKIVKVTEAELTYVALDEYGNKRLLPPLND